MQRGYGFGSFFRNLQRRAMPMLKEAAMNVGKALLESTLESSLASSNGVVRDVIEPQLTTRKRNRQNDGGGGRSAKRIKGRIPGKNGISRVKTPKGAVEIF